MIRRGNQLAIASCFVDPAQLAVRRQTNSQKIPAGRLSEFKQACSLFPTTPPMSLKLVEEANAIREFCIAHVRSLATPSLTFGKAISVLSELLPKELYASFFPGRRLVF